VLASGARVSGCTVHFVTRDPDAGPVIVQTAVPVEDDDTAATLSARVRREELRAYPLAVRLFAEGRLQVQGNRVHVLPPRTGGPDRAGAAPSDGRGAPPLRSTPSSRLS
jgi:phosphoribosylglycinamide formyltransferase-1